MKLFHGSSSRNIGKFNFRHCRKSGTDYGKGVYFTSNFEQAKEWSCKHSKTGAVYECDVDLSQFLIKEYPKKEEDLLYIIFFCRMNFEDIACDAVDDFEKADVISGLMLGGNIKKFKLWANRFNRGDIGFDEFSKRVKLFKNGYDQICIKNQAALNKVNASIEKVYYTEKSKNGIQVMEEHNRSGEQHEG